MLIASAIALDLLDLASGAASSQPPTPDLSSAHTIASRNASQAGTRYVGYVSDPNGRGTVSLIISCGLTLILCVWSALHLNVPDQRATRVGRLWLSTKWVLAGIYSPELVLFAAWRQWSSARLLQKRVEQSCPGRVRRVGAAERLFGGTERTRNGWTMTHSYFACSGGFAFELDSLRGAVSPLDADDKGPRRFTLTAKGIAALAKCGELPLVAKEEIDDKSKANDLAKAAVIIQATWMMLQVLTRLIFSLPVTLLEVNTVAHVICTLGMYLLWWDKPQLPNEPIILRKEELAPLMALLYTSSEMSGYTDPQTEQAELSATGFLPHLMFFKIPDIDSLCWRSPVVDGASTGSENADLSSQPAAPSQPSTNEDKSKEGEQPTSAIHFDSLVLGFAPDACSHHLDARRKAEQQIAFFERRPLSRHHRAAAQQPSATDRMRWDLIQMAFRTYPGLFRDRLWFTHDAEDGSRCTHLRPEALVVDHVQNWPSSELLHGPNKLINGVAFWLVELGYGAFHAAAWDDHFPSAAERWLWRASACFIGFCGAFWVILNFAVTGWKWVDSFFDAWLEGRRSLLVSLFLYSLVVFCGTSLILSRVYIVVECFVSIRELPIKAYDTPNWSIYFPHF